MSVKPPGPLAENLKHFHDFISVITTGVGRHPFADRDVLVHEVRVVGLPSGNPKYPPKTLIGFFDLTQPVRLWDAVKPFLSPPEKAQPEGVYVTANPVDPDLLAVADHEFKAGVGGATDADVLARNFFYLDADPVRRAKVSATDAEKAAAWAVLGAARADLAGRGFPPPMVVDSGNGYHAWFRVQLPRDDAGVVENLLKALARRHDTVRAKVDTTVFNPSRLCKLPGTYARKGSSVATRPHRMARVLEVPPC